ncbi:YlcG family protein [Kluyvera intermedia]
MIIDRLIISSLREKWRLLRTYRYSGSVLVDYRILRNNAHRLFKTLEKKA